MKRRFAVGHLLAKVVPSLPELPHLSPVNTGYVVGAHAGRESFLSVYGTTEVVPLPRPA
jgi:hypothetical protein